MLETCRETKQINKYMKKCIELVISKKLLNLFNILYSPTELITILLWVRKCPAKI